MKISGFTICRNGVRLGFPFLESLRSLAPLCDEIVVALGDSSDETAEQLERLKVELKEVTQLKFIPTQWNLESIKGGSELARQTNIALEACENEIAFYLQADEVLHENDYPTLRKDIELLAQHPQAASLLLQWTHFFGNAKQIVHSRKWYRREIRVIKKSSGLKSFKDAQSFRKPIHSHWEKLPTIESSARVFHYGWIRPSELMAVKANEFQFWWSGKSGKNNKESIFRPQYGVQDFNGNHPAVMAKYLQSLPPAAKLSRQSPVNIETVRLAASDVIEKMSGWRPGEFKNFSKVYRGPTS